MSHIVPCQCQFRATGIHEKYCPNWGKVAALWILMLALTACTIIPKPVAAPAVASVGVSGKRDSGLLSRLPNGAGYIIDAHLRDRYNGLVATYGAEPHFQPALQPDQGLSVLATGEIVLSVRAMSDLALMNGWRREGRIPTPKPGFIQRMLQ